MFRRPAQGSEKKEACRGFTSSACIETVAVSAQLKKRAVNAVARA